MIQFMVARTVFVRGKSSKSCLIARKSHVISNNGLSSTEERFMNLFERKVTMGRMQQ